MTDKKIMALDPAALTAFAAHLSHLPKEEISKAKRLYILNAIEVWKDDLGPDYPAVLARVPR